ncbi:F-box/LRR-repeat protein At4g14103-like [Lotus japonicus]|uniref:F-box/LRR-repeat protein At4g14103-like n=1 Tax=Lotus japonicus TaxID=34305 RepID=UPI00258DC0A0|nr:F-box/LRR-repeat protein At4g14103-like [Lotus japonicus]XP_057451042.1 F-box/LRR-repeat protein At4g14103-like [Lotus japonicus]
MSNSTDEMLIPPNAKRGRNSENENEDNKDRLSDLPDGILLHILSFMNAKYAVQTCILSARWKDLWKHLPTLMLCSSNPKHFTKFVSTILTLRDGSTALHGLDFYSISPMEPQFVKKTLDYAVSHNVQRLEMNVNCDMQHLLPCIFTCHTLTSLKLTVSGRRTLFPKHLNLPALTTLHLVNFTFCSSGSDSARADPFLLFNRLESLIMDRCDLKDAQILCISSKTLVNLTLRYPLLYIYTIELSAPCLYRFTCTYFPSQFFCGSGLPSVKEVNIDAKLFLDEREPPLILLTWLQDLVNVRLLTVTTSTLQVLFLVPHLLKIKHSSLANLKRLIIRQEQLSLKLRMIMRSARLERAATVSLEEAAKLRKEAAMLLETLFDRTAPLPPLPDGIVNFLIQNSPSAEVEIIDCLI